MTRRGPERVRQVEVTTPLEEQIMALVDRRIAELGLKPANDPAPQLVTIAAYAKARSISESTVRRAIREHRLPAVKIGAAVRVRAADEIGRAVKPAANDIDFAAAARAYGVRSRR